MTPRGFLAYLLGIAGLLFTGCIAGLIVLFVLALPARPGPEAPILLLVCAALVFAALHVVAAGLYRMLVHLYHTISRTDPAGDRRLRGRTFYLLGQIATAMTAPPTFVFIAVALSEARQVNGNLGVALFGVLPTGGALLLAVVAFLAGLGLMVRDLFLRHQDIVEAREAERRRRLEEPDEPEPEILPPAGLTLDKLREHIREDR